MSLAHRLLTIEEAIAYEDVQDSWRFDREVWMCEVVEAMHDPQRLAALTLKMLSMLTPGCVAYYWKKPSDYKRLNEACLKLAGSKSDPTGKALKAIIKEVEGLILDENESENALLSTGKPDEFAIGETGPELHVNDLCGALDIRMAWCPAQVVQRRLGPGGAVQYRVHYDGWKKRWDEWVARDSGRIRSELPATNPPRKIDSKAKAKASKEAGKDKEAGKPAAKGSQVLPRAPPLARAVPLPSRPRRLGPSPLRLRRVVAEGLELLVGRQEEQGGGGPFRSRRRRRRRRVASPVARVSTGFTAHPRPYGRASTAALQHSSTALLHSAPHSTS